MALTGLRPLKETNTLGNSPTHYATLNGAYDIYVQDQYAAAEANTTYYAAKWIKLAAGNYQIRFIIDDTGTLKLNGQQVASGTNGGDWVTPVVQTFTLATSDTYRLDLTYTNVPGGSPSFICYELSKDGVVVEVSRANDFIGDLKPIPDSALGPKPPYNEDVRLSYPVFLPKPDWQSGVLERLEWLTDVLQSESGAEQRRKLRQYPRRSLEASFSRFGNNRNLIDSYLTGVGQRYGLVPLWWDETPIDPVYSGSIDIFGDFRRREFFANDVVIIRREGELDYELNIIAEKTDTKLTLLYGTQKDTKHGTISPVRVAQVRDQLGGSQLTDAVRQFQLRFYTLEAADYTTAWTFPIYSRTNLPVLNWIPNYREQMDLTFDRVAFQWDNQVGNVYVVDPGATATTNEKYGYTIFGRDAMHDFKCNIYKMAGRWREVHVPTGHDEFVLTRDISASQGAIIVARSGYNQYNLSQQAIRRDICIELYDGTKLFNTIISSRVVEDEEWLFLSETVPSLPLANVRRISYMPRSRLDIDAIEINRLTDADGASQVALTFKAIVERRNAPPIPIQ
jgi:hypothetical protein